MNVTMDVIVDEGLFASVNDNVKNSVVVKATKGGINGFVRSILDALGRDIMTAWKETNIKSNKISVLRLWSHGYVNFANSEKENGNIIFGIDNLKADNFENYKTNLAALTPHFANPARVELRGCIAAKGTGRKMMIDLASLWNVDVYGTDKYNPLILLWPSTVFLAKPSAKDLTPTNGPGVN